MASLKEQLLSGKGKEVEDLREEAYQVSAAQMATRIKFGEIRNKTGRPKVPKHLRAIKRLDKDIINRVLNLYLSLPVGQLDALMTDPRTPALDACVISIIINCIKRGDYLRLTFLFDRIIGKFDAKALEDEISKGPRTLEEMLEQIKAKKEAEKNILKNAELAHSMKDKKGNND